MKTKEMLTRKECTYEEFISQFVDGNITKRLLQVFTINELKKSKCPHFNDIELKKWDRLTGYGMKGIKQPARTHQAIRDAGDSPTYSLYTAIYKAAARKILTEVKK